MDFDFSLILVVLSALTGFIWLVDHLFFAKARQRAAEADAPQTDSEASDVPAPAIVEYSRSFFPVLFIVLIVRSFLIEPFQIPSGSMLPTLEVGDFILVNKFDYGLRVPVWGKTFVPIGKPERGDVMVFKGPHNRINYIKRVIGLPGDEIQFQRQRLMINGELIDETFVGRIPCQDIRQEICHVFREVIGDESHLIQKYLLDRNPDVEGRWLVPEGHYLVMGDNRDNSRDSRPRLDGIGLIPDENIVGRAFAIWMHWERFFSLPSFGRVGTID